MKSASAVNFGNYQISVVTDDPADARTLKEMKCEAVVVPNSFTTNAIRKGRALQYAVEYRRRNGMNTSKYWIFHMDDESYVTPQTILALLKAIREGGAVASEGPIFYPLKFESANRLTAIAESIRPFACYDCVSQMTNPPPVHMHGSNLLVRSDVEDAIGWQFGPILAEDQMFGYKVFEKYGTGSMGWHGGMLLEQPPLSIKDHFFQRRRWVLGTLQNLRKFPRRHQFRLLYRSVTYFLGFASAVSSVAVMAFNYLMIFTMQDYARITDVFSISSRLGGDFSASGLSFDLLLKLLASVNPVEFVIAAIMFFILVVWLGSYQLGLFSNLKYSKIGWPKRILFHAQALVIAPAIGLVETFPAFWATLEYCITGRKLEKRMPVYDFYIIKK
jgi:cellulose synthase/poly-beta-1,6-N-acetylglucosamine synthase-like glycosyltransferase